jgi:DNA-binding NtrC family response regulator
MPSALAGLRVLVVDDELFIADHLQLLLEEAGCTVIGPVAAIDKALAIVRGEQLDGVLLDANLNGQSSVAIAEELLAMATPFVVVTGYGKLPLAAALNEAPRLGKPFDSAELEQMLAATFVRKS